MRTPDSEEVDGGGGIGSLADGYGTVVDGDDTDFGQGAGDETRAVDGDQGPAPAEGGDASAAGAEDAGEGDGLDFDGDGDVDFDDLQELIADIFDGGDDDAADPGTGPDDPEAAAGDGAGADGADLGLFEG